MAEQQNYAETMLDIAPMLDEFPMDEFDEDLLSPMLQEHDQLGFHQDGQLVIPSYGEFIDPDMFLNGVVKRESESDCSSSSRRNTPSPSDSHQSYESYPSSGYGSCQSNNPVNNILLESPPVSPENPSHSPPHIVTVPGVNVVRVGSAQLPTVQKPSCGTKLADLKKIKLPPKGSVTKKTIVLTAKDYQALVRNIKNQNSNGTILIKATPASAFAVAAKDKPVQPKPAIVPQQVEPAPVVVAAPAPPQPVVPPPPKLVSNGSSVDDRALKRHQRMIKNRESAFLSRVRKKEYVTSLEQQIDNLQQENQYLKNENIQLLEKLKLRCPCGATTIGTTASFSKQITPNMRKNTAIVLAMLFMVSLNLGPIGNLLSSNGDRTLMESTPAEPHHQRSLLWLDEANKFNVDASANVTSFDNPSPRPSPVEDAFSVCPFYVNQTENIRLARELRRWIGENGYKNVTDRDGDDMSISSFSEMFALKDTIDSMYRQMKDISSQMETFKKRNKRAALSKKRITGGKKARELELYQQQQQHRGKKDADLAFYYGGFGKKYAKFFEEIGRRDDTFYLVSFSGEHLLLPALAHNKTSRPKMSLMLPAVMDNGTHPSDKVTLMQIDCEVMNTSMIQIREKTIPGDLLRPNAATKPDYPKQPVKRATRDQTTDEFVEHGVRNVSSNGNDNGVRKQLNRELNHKHHAASPPFFVQRMGEHLKAELDLN
uniref:Putative bzip transcription factor atf6 n=1 Tax=Culex tarsalis TaxID=7177 RepID=A0A1Q3FGC8_CULTA